MMAAIPAMAVAPNLRGQAIQAIQASDFSPQTKTLALLALAALREEQLQRIYAVLTASLAALQRNDAATFRTTLAAAGLPSVFVETILAKFRATHDPRSPQC